MTDRPLPSDLLERLRSGAERAMREQNFGEAQRLAQKALVLVPSDEKHATILFRGLAAARLYDEASRFGRRCVVLMPAEPVVRRALMRVRFSDGDFAGAAGDAHALLAAGGDASLRPDALLEIARVLRRHGDIERASDLARHAISREGALARTWRIVELTATVGAFDLGRSGSGE